MSNDQKIRIEKGSVQETLLVPLYGRKMCSEKFPSLYTDSSARAICERIEYDFSPLEAKKDTFVFEFGALEAAMRQIDMMYEIKDYLASHPEAAVVNLGCGLDQSGRAVDNGKCHIYNIDFPDIITARNELSPAGEREVNIASDLKDYSWMDKIDASKGVILFAAGVFHYFKKDEVKALVLEMSDRYPGGRLVFDTVGKTGLKLMMKKTLKNMGIKGVESFFYVDDIKDISWSDKISVSSKGYMLGYSDMKCDGIGFMHRLLAKVGDGYTKMAIIRMDF